jgi:hypothetical protein
MAWTGGMPFGLFSGTRTFTLTPTPNGEVVFTMREGIRRTLGWFDHPIDPDLQPAFDAFAADLKRAAERMR